MLDCPVIVAAIPYLFSDSCTNPPSNSRPSEITLHSGDSFWEDWIAARELFPTIILACEDKNPLWNVHDTTSFTRS